MRKFTHLVFLFFSLCIFSQTGAYFQIAEVLPNTLDDKNLEYITLKNISDTHRSLENYTLSDKKKTFTITDEQTIAPGEKRVFFRTETKLVLNNTNEEIYLHNSGGDLVYEVSYKTSIKGEFLNFEKIEIPETESIISSEKYISGEPLWISDEATTGNAEINGEVPDSNGEKQEEEPQKENQTHEENSQEGGDSDYVDDEEQEQEVNSVPEVIISLQQPSYITKLGENEYVCDDERDECKVNFDLRESFSDNLPEGDYVCTMNMEFDVDDAQTSRCNPNTIIIPQGEYSIIFTITHEDDQSLQNSFIFVIKNIGETGKQQEEESGNINGDAQGENQNQQGNEIDKIGENDMKQEEESPQEEIEETEEVEKILSEKEDSTEEMLSRVPEIIYSFQIPSYISESQEREYICEDDRDECKINFDLRESFLGEFPERDYICHVDTGFVTGQEMKCNPNTIVFPEGEHEVIFRITHEDDNSVYTEKKIRIVHHEQIIDIGGSSGSTSSSGGDENNYINNGEDTLSKIYIHYPKIIIQSGLTGTGRYFFCENEECKINLEYEKGHSDERCFWDFGSAEQSSSSTHTRCNPGYATFGPGKHEFSLKVYEDDNEQNFKRAVFYIHSLEQEKTQEKGEDEILSSKLGKFRKQEFTIPQTKILLQGKIGKEKQLISDQELMCRSVDTCFVNLNSETSASEHIIQQEWSLNGEIFHTGENPKGVWLSSGSHIIVLSTTLGGDEITKNEYKVTVTGKNTVFPDIEKTQEGPDGKEETVSQSAEKLSDFFTQNFYALKYDGLRVSGKAPTGSTVKVYVGERLFGVALTGSNGRYRIVSNNMSPGAYQFRTELEYRDGTTLFIGNSGEMLLPASKTQNWWVSSKGSLKTSVISAKSSEDTQMKLNIGKILGKNNDDEKTEISLPMRIFLLTSILGFIAIVTISVVYHKMILLLPLGSNALGLTFSTRQKINLILK